jgi:transcriptional regulator with XRE-family HTH domain
MAIARGPQIRAICDRTVEIAARMQGTSTKEVVQRQVVRMQALLRDGRLQEAENAAYGILMYCIGQSGSEEEESAENHETSKTPMLSVKNTVNIGRSIKFVRVAAGLRQGEMAERLDISQNYLSLLENNKSEPSLSLLRKISSEFHVPLSFLLLEGSVEFDSDEPELADLLKEVQKLIHQLQESRIKEGGEPPNGSVNGSE